MSEIKHTPWKAIKAPHGPIDIFDSRGYDIVTLYGEDKEQIANIFSAAPELLEAARVGLQYIEAVCFNTPNPKKRKNYADAASIIRAAISKAEGQS